jgi:cytochrome c-type biogenesis protein CcmH/NrfG
MTQLYVSIAVGTTATVLAAILVLLRAKWNGRRPIETFAHWWLAASARTSLLITALLAVIALLSFGHLGEVEQSKVHNERSTSDLVEGSRDRSSQTPELASLRAYTDTLETHAKPTAPTAAELSDVDTMIVRLAARLEREPDDVKGWKMLGWSYLNMNRAGDAVRAYEKARKLDPGDPAITTALDQAKAALTAAYVTSPSDQTASTTAPTTIAADGLPSAGHDSMLRSMVDKLATRLERAPNDEDGWLHLLRSHVTLDERDAAKAALSRAKATFANDAAALGRLSTAARELGVENQ